MEAQTLPTKWHTSGQRISVRILILTHLYTPWITGSRPLVTYCNNFLLFLCAGGESAVKLLTKFGLLEAAVDYATDN